LGRRATLVRTSPGAPDVARCDRGQPEQLDVGVHPRLAGLPLHHVEQPVAVAQHEAGEREHDLDPLGHRPVRPLLLGGPRAGRGCGECRGFGLRDLGQRFAGERRDRARGPVTGTDDPVGQRLDVGGVDAWRVAHRCALANAAAGIGCIRQRRGSRRTTGWAARTSAANRR
jgi:hypothetical protein